MRSYIPGVDGLRAIAVAAVVVFHVYPSLLRGGFIGVDVFFVISGFIITSTYYDSIASGHVTLRHFFVKRVRRLAPIYLVVLLLVTIASFVVLPPIHLEHLAESLFAQPVYLQNVVFWHHGDYFDEAFTKPLLHTWSLAVEEQFYLVYAAIMLITRRWQKAGAPVMILGSLLSFALAWKLSSVSPKTAFYWLPPRFWQMALGVLASRAVAAFGKESRFARGARHGLIPGLLLIGWAIIGFDEHARYPGPQSIFACSGTALALVALATSEGGALVQVLETRPLSRIGKLSYSLYLWHWPIISLYSVHVNRVLSPAEAVVVVVLTFVVSDLGYRFVEKPVRSGARIPSDRHLLVLAALGGVVTLGTALVLVFTNGATFRYPPEIAVLYKAQQDRSPFRCPRFSRLADLGAELCPINGVSGEKNVLVLGDSHADVLDEVIAAAAARDGHGAYLTKRDCKIFDYGQRPDCPLSVLDHVHREVVAHHIHHVFVMGYVHRGEWEEVPSSLDENLGRLLDVVERVFILQVAPNDVWFDPAERARRLLAHEPLPAPYTMKEYREDNRHQLARYRELAARNPKITILDPTPLLCPEDACAFATDGAPNYFDAHHLSPTGARRVSPLFESALKSLPR